jgi:flagellar biosynthesis/type III secretory pathway protein FliH
MGNNSKKTISSAGQGSEPLGSGLGADRDNPEQRPLAEGEASGKTETSLDGIDCQDGETYHKGFQRGYRLGYQQILLFVKIFQKKITVLEKQVAHWKEIAKR